MKCASASMDVFFSLENNFIPKPKKDYGEWVEMNQKFAIRWKCYIKRDKYTKPMEERTCISTELSEAISNKVDFNICINDQLEERKLQAATKQTSFRFVFVFCLVVVLFSIFRGRFRVKT